MTRATPATIAARLVAAAIALAAAPAAARPDKPTNADLYRYAQGERVESFASKAGNFRIHFTRAGMNAVPDDDADKSGVPDYVEESAALYEEVLALYRKLGFRAPIPDLKLGAGNGGDGRFDVYLLDFAGRADGSFRSEACDGAGLCTGFMVQENDFAGYPYPTRTIGARILASHELFHAVQAAYDSREGSIAAEGSAVWATERFDPSLDDLEGFVAGYLSRPDRSLDKPLPGPVDAFSYGSGIFFQFLDEKYGAVALRELWEATVGDGAWFAGLDQLLRNRHAASFADAFAEFARWNLFTGRRADPKRGYARGSGFPLVRIDPEKLPLATPSLRLFPAASLYLRVTPGARTRVGAALVATEGRDALRLTVVARRGDRLDPLANAGPDLTATVDATGADEVIVLLINTAQSGDSLKPALCAGDEKEIAACRAQFDPTPPGDMAMVQEMPPPMAGGCAVGGPARGSWPLALLLFLALVGYALRRQPRISRPRWCHDRYGGGKCVRRAGAVPPWRARRAAPPGRLVYPTSTRPSRSAIPATELFQWRSFSYSSGV